MCYVLCASYVSLCTAPAELDQENRHTWWHFCAVTVISVREQCAVVCMRWCFRITCSMMHYCCHLNFAFDSASWQLKGISSARSFTHVHRIPLEYGIHICSLKYFVKKFLMNFLFFYHFWVFVEVIADCCCCCSRHKITLRTWSSIDIVLDLDNRLRTDMVKFCWFFCMMIFLCWHGY